MMLEIGRSDSESRDLSHKEGNKIRMKFFPKQRYFPAFFIFFYLPVLKTS